MSWFDDHTPISKNVLLVFRVSRIADNVKSIRVPGFQSFSYCMHISQNS